ncbi:hypothetical protein A8926_2725 [Saccharopolyspora spinosa]|uniref:Uncharacterized protein n=1 Tax=Saccharopolyspora spinosa TaxID=60894 RepID=A0A2N3XWJ8_SACSN|nr:hypothetical protein A8926_2725 [Saccharopolyspora spinosa]
MDIFIRHPWWPSIVDFAELENRPTPNALTDADIYAMIELDEFATTRPIRVAETLFTGRAG